MSKILNDSELQEIRERCEAASPGPWTTEPWDDYPAVAYHILDASGDYDVQYFVPLDKHYECGPLADCSFIAHARHDIPALLDHIDALAASLDAEAAAHSVTRAALVASPEWVDSPGGGNASCPHCHGMKWHEGHADDCLRRVALEQAP